MMDYCHDIVDTTHSKKHQVLAGGTEECNHDSVFVETELCLAVSWCQPRSPYSDEREPSYAFSYPKDQRLDKNCLPQEASPRNTNPEIGIR